MAGDVARYGTRSGGGRGGRGSGGNKFGGSFSILSELPFFLEQVLVLISEIYS